MDRTIITISQFEIRLWSLETRKLLHEIKHVEGDLFSAAALSPDGKTIASVSVEGDIVLWNAEHGKIITTLKNHTKESRGFLNAYIPDMINHNPNFIPKHIIFSQDGKTILYCSENASIQLWDVETQEHKLLINQFDAQVTSTAINSEGSLIAIGLASGSIVLFDVESKRITSTLQGHKKPIISLAISPDGNKLVSGSKDHTVKLWGLYTKSPH